MSTIDSNLNTVILLLFLGRFLINIIKLCKRLLKLDFSALRQDCWEERTEQKKNMVLVKIRTHSLNNNNYINCVIK